jgi:hypothetical protein
VIVTNGTKGHCGDHQRGNRRIPTAPRGTSTIGTDTITFKARDAVDSNRGDGFSIRDHGREPCAGRDRR